MTTRRPSTESDEELCRRAKRGDSAAWRLLVRRHTPMVYRIAARMLGPGAEAEDACQEAFLKMHRSFDQYDLSRPLGPWLGRIAYHEGLKRLAKVSKAGVSVDPAQMVHLEDDESRSPERAAASEETGELLAAALDKLSAQDRALVTLRYREGFTDVEVAEAVGMNRNTVRTRLFRARSVLKRALAPVFGGGSA